MLAASTSDTRRPRTPVSSLMRDLGDIYESARVSIPLRVLPERNTLLCWNDLDERVHSELDVLQDRIFLALDGDEQMLVNHHRVIDDFNRGVSQGVLAGPGQSSPSPGEAITHSPFQWGRAVGFRAKGRGREELALIRQFTTVTRLLAYEFRQLDMAFTRPVDFLMRNVGPDRADEFGELGVAVPVLLDFRRELIARIIDEPGFSFSEYHITQACAPSHLEYLSQGIVALFDPEPGSWIRVAANFGLATRPFIDGTTLRSEHFQSPDKMAVVVASMPIAARMIVRRQMERIELARYWTGSDVGAIDLAQEDRAPTTLWDVYQSTHAAVIRGQRSYLADVVANNVARLLSEHMEAALAPQDTRLGYLRRHLPAFTRGFDARSERVVDVRAITSAQFGRKLSDGLRRFENGGLYIAGVSAVLAELGVTVNELHHSLDNIPAFARNVLFDHEETDLARQLSNLFDAHPTLAADLFGEHSQYEFFSRTQIQIQSPFDLMRRALFQIVQAVRPFDQHSDSTLAWLDGARSTLRRLVALGDTRAAPRPVQETAASSYYVADTHSGSGPELEESLTMTAARQFEREFETLTRVMRRIVHPLHMARMLNKQQAS